MSILAAGIILAITSDQQIERPSDSEFLRLFTRMGFTRHKTSQDSVGSPVKKLKLGASEFFLTWNTYLTKDLSSTYVGEGRAQIEFDLPTPLPKMAFAHWMKREGLEQISASSLIGGRIKISYVLLDEKSTWSTLNQRTNEFLIGAEKVKNLVQSLGGKMSSSINQFGTAKYDPSFRFDWIEKEDVEFLKQQMGWKDDQRFGGDLAHVISVQVGKIPVYVNALGWPNKLYIGTRAVPDKAKAEKFLESGSSIKWAEGSVSTSLVRLYGTFNFPNGVTARELVHAIEGFAENVGKLNIM